MDSVEFQLIVNLLSVLFVLSSNWWRIIESSMLISGYGICVVRRWCMNSLASSTSRRHVTSPWTACTVWRLVMDLAVMGVKQRWVSVCSYQTLYCLSSRGNDYKKRQFRHQLSNFFYTPVIWRTYHGMALSICPSIRSVVHNSCGQDLARTMWPRMLKLSVYTSYGKRKKSIYFQGQRSNFKVTAFIKNSGTWILVGRI